MAYDADVSDAPPVKDWINDWDWLDDQWGPNAIDIWNEVRAQCARGVHRAIRPGVHAGDDGWRSPRWPTTPTTSRRGWVSVGRPDAPRVPPAPPITSDPPEHHGHRRLVLLPSFSPKIDRPDGGRPAPPTAGVSSSPISTVHERVDAAEQYSQHIPVHGICQLTGIPEADADLFRDWIYRNFQLAPRDNNVRVQVIQEMTEYIDGASATTAWRQPRDDLAHLHRQRRDRRRARRLGPQARIRAGC